MEKLQLEEILLFGSALAPFPAWLLHRGMRTLNVRLRQHEAAGNFLSDWLHRQPWVEVVHHVSAPDFPQRDLYLKQMRGSGGLLSFEPNFQDRAAVARFVDSLQLFQIGVSWGGFESLCVPLYLQPMGYTEPRWVLRLYCGLEDPEDLIADLEQAYAAAI